MGFLQEIKREKFYFYTSNIVKALLPGAFYRMQLKRWLSKSQQYDSKTFQERLTYYVSDSIDTQPTKDWVALKYFKRPKKGTLYFFDLVRYTKYFSRALQINYKFGDVTEEFEEPTLVKSRPIQHNGNSVLMKLDALRHFHFIEDKKPFAEKNDQLVWRGEIHKENRKLLVEKFHDHPLCNIGEVSDKDWYPEIWKKEFLSIEEQLNYKFIISIEGIDVATNLKWIMSSNSLCFMPTPKYETWFMEGKLIPNHHYVHIKDDYSDLLEKRAYYLAHPEEAQTIIRNANAWVDQFRNEELEKVLSLSVLDAFFKKTHQTKSN